MKKPVIPAKAGTQTREDIAPDPVADHEPVIMVAHDQLIPSPSNPRSDMDPDKLEALMHSIVAHGVLQNLRGRPDGMGNWFIIAGHRRHMAMGMAIERGLIERDGVADLMPLHPVDADDARALTEALVENLHREDMHALDEARAFEQLQILNQCDAEKVAGMVGLEPRYVQYRLRLLEKLSPKVIETFRKNAISFTQARELCAADHEVQETLLNRMTDSGYYRTTDELARAVKWEQEAKEHRVRQAAEAAEPDPDEAARRQAEIDELNRQREQTRLASEQRMALLKADEKKLAGAYRQALMADPKATARGLLFEWFARWSDDCQIVGCNLDAPEGGMTPLVHPLLGIEPGEDEEDDAWNERLWERLQEIDDPIALALRTAAAAACPVSWGWRDNTTGYGPSVGLYARKLAVHLRVPVPSSLGAAAADNEQPDDAAGADEEEGAEDGE